MNIRKNKKAALIFIALAIALLAVPRISAQLTSSIQTPSQAVSPFAYYGDAAQYYFPSYSQEQCEAGQDFFLEIPLTGCSPSIVRSDLLEEQDVPVFCRLVGTKLNPVIEIPHIKDIKISPGDANKSEIRNILFHPARAGLTQPFAGLVGSPQLNDLGYLVVVLKRKATEAEMPEIITANLTTRITYEVEKSFGITSSQFLLPAMTEEEWNSDYQKYSFWKGKGYIRAENVEKDSAKIKMYKDDNTAFDTFTLKVNDKTLPRYMPGFYCSAGYKVKLDAVEYPQLRAEIYVNGDKYLVSKGMKLDDTGCEIKNIIPSEYGLGGSVTLSCPDGTYTLTKGIIEEAELKISLGGKEKKSAYKILDEVKLDAIGGVNPPLYFAYAIKMYDTENKRVRDVAVLVEIEQGKKVTKFIKEIRKEMKEYLNENSDKLSIKSDNELKKEIEEKLDDQILFDINNKFNVDIEPHVAINEGDITTKSGKNQNIHVKIEKILGLYNKQYAQIIEDYYKEAKANYIATANDYPDLKDANGVYYGAKALSEIAEKAGELGKSLEQAELLADLIKRYPNTGIAGDARKELSGIYSESGLGEDTKYITSNGKTYTLTLGDIIEPSIDELSVELSIDENPSSKYALYDELSNNNWQISAIDENKATFESTNSTEKIIINEGAEKTFGGIKVKVVKINLKKLAKISIEPWSNKGVTYANFTFNIGIEKRAIQLNTEQTQNLMDSIDKEIVKWDDAYNKLGKLVKTWKNACLVGAGALWVLNAIDTVGTAETIARRDVMRGFGDQPGMISICDGLVSEGKYPSTTICLQDKEDEIDKQIKVLSGTIGDYNSKVKGIETSDKVMNETDGGVLGGKRKFINRDLVAKEMQDKFFATSDNGYWVDSKGNPTTDVSQRSSFVYKSDIKFTDATGKEKTLTNNEVGGVLGYTAKLYEEGQIYTEDQKELAKYLGLIDKCKTESLDKTFCSNVNNAFGRKIDSLIGSKRSVEKQSSTLDAINSALGTTFKYIPVLKEEKTQELAAEIESMDIIGMKKLTSDENILKGLSPKFEVMSFMTEKAGVEYMAIVSSIGGGKYKIERLFELENKKIKSEILKDKYPLGLGVITGVTAENCCANSKYSGELKIRYWESGVSRGLPAFIPLTNIKPGYYFLTTSTYGFGQESYKESGKLNRFWLCGVGADGKPDYDFTIGPRGDDKGCCVLIDLNTNINERAKSIGITDKDIDKVFSCAAEAAQNFNSGKKNTGVSCCPDCTIGKPAVSSPIERCEDFMSPSECSLMFNLCDPVICPTSRCDLGGRYPVDDVIQTGIIGGLTLCLPNLATENIIVPLCLTGIHAGIDNVLTIMKSTKACLNESLATGRQIGICDQLKSVYLCEMFWREITPFLRTGIPALVEKGFLGGLFGTRVTGGEYRTFSDSWNTAANSAKFIVDYYGQEIFRAFTIKSLAEAGSFVCQQFISIKYPDAAGVIDELTEPESPYQVNALFYETPLTTATSPAMSQYKVYYHLYAGKDAGHYYSIYLTQPASPGYYQTTEIYPVPGAQGYLGQGQFVDSTPDFTAPVGYKEICVRVDGKDHCGFGKATTTFGVQEITDYYTASQASEEVNSEEECIAGTSGLIAPNLNPQQMIEETLNPALYKRGINRICSSMNPGLGTTPERWTRVGFCDSERKITCWLDEDSVKGAIKDLGLQNKTLSEAEKIAMSLLDSSLYISKDEAEKIFNDIENTLKKKMAIDIRDLRLKEQLEKGVPDAAIRKAIINAIGAEEESGEKVIPKLNYLLKKSSVESENTKAKAQFQKGVVYNNITMSFISQPVEKELFRVNFDYDSFQLDETQKEKVKTDMLEAMKGLGEGKIMIIGYASEDGEEDYNFGLSTKRAVLINEILKQMSNTLSEKKIFLAYSSGGETSQFSREKYTEEEVHNALQDIEKALPEEKATIASTGEVNDILKEDRIVRVVFEGKLLNAVSAAKTESIEKTTTTYTKNKYLTQENLAFFKKVYSCLQNTDRQGIPTALIISAAAYESNWGKSISNNNYFDISGKSYSSLCDSINGFVGYIHEKYSSDISIYSQLMAKKIGPKYSTDGKWAENVMDIIESVPSFYNAAGYEIGTTEPETAETGCTLTNADWATKSGSFRAVEGDTVELHVLGQNCKGRSITFVVREQDSWTSASKETMQKSFAKGESLADNPKDGVFDSYDRAVVKWDAVWTSDGALRGDPEYAFMGLMSKEAGDTEQPVAFSTNLLKVIKGREIVISNPVYEVEASKGTAKTQ